MKHLLSILLISSICLTQELQVDGDLKVTGTVDAQGNPITNVGAPQTLTDAVNAGILASALSDDGVYEYKILSVYLAWTSSSGGWMNGARWADLEDITNQVPSNNENYYNYINFYNILKTSETSIIIEDIFKLQI